MISDTEARRIASEWHGGGGTALYAFASTGAIDTARADHALTTEIDDCIAYIDDPSNRRDKHWTDDVALADRQKLLNLSDYVAKHGARGPVDGWGELSW